MNIASNPKLLIQKLTIRYDWRINVLLVLPLILISINGSWLFIYPLQGLLDPWIYTGYFLDFKSHLVNFSTTYFGSRLPWILPGYFVHKIFPPLLANTLLHLIYYYTSICSLYLILKNLFTKQVAFLTVLLMGTFIYFLRSFGSNYIDGAAITYLLLTLFFLTPSSQSKKARLGIFFSGFFYSCLLFTQIFSIAFTPFLLFYYFIFFRCYPKKAYFFFLTGFLMATFTFCCINKSYQGEFFFFLPALKTAARLTINNDFWLPFSHWGKQAPWTYLPLTVAFGSLLTLFIYQFSQYQIALLLQLLYLLNCLIFLLFQFFEKQPVIQHSYYLCYLFPSLFLAIGGQIALFVDYLSSSSIFFNLFTGIVALLSFTLPSDCFVLPHWLIVFIILTFLNYACHFYKGSTQKLLGVTFFILSFGILNLSQNYAKKSTPSQATQKSAFIALYRGFEKINIIDPQKKGVFWFNQKEPQNTFYWALCCNHLCHQSLLNAHLPKIDSTNLFVTPKEQGKVFVLSTLENPIEEAKKGLAPMGFTCHFDQEAIIEEGPFFFKITSLNIEKNKT